MHEMALAEGVRSIVDNAARAHRIRDLEAVVLEIGQLSCVDPEALRFALGLALRGSAAERARIEIESIPGEGWCLACDRSVPLASRADACTSCGSYRIQPLRGTEMRVRELLLQNNRQ